MAKHLVLFSNRPPLRYPPFPRSASTFTSCPSQKPESYPGFDSLWLDKSNRLLVLTVLPHSCCLLLPSPHLSLGLCNGLHLEHPPLCTRGCSVPRGNHSELSPGHRAGSSLFVPTCSLPLHHSCPSSCLSATEGFVLLHFIAFIPLRPQVPPAHPLSETPSVFDSKSGDSSSLFPWHPAYVMLATYFKIFLKNTNRLVSIFIKCHFYLDVCLCRPASPIS